MNKMEIPKCKINTNEAIRKTIVNGICNTVRETPNGNCINFDDIVENLGFGGPEYSKYKYCSIKEAKARLSKILTYYSNCTIVDKSGVCKEELEALRLKSEAMKKIKTATQEMKSKNMEITEKTILEYLDSQDARNHEKYRTWITVFCSQGIVNEGKNVEER